MNTVRAALMCENPGVNGSGVRIAVLDTGVDADHPDLARQIDHDRGTSTCIDGDTIDRHGHGTHVAGIIAGTGHESDGRYRGIAPGASLIIIKVVPGWRGIDLDVAKGVEVAIDAGADIINYSGGHRPSVRPPWQWPTKLSKRDQAFELAAKEGVLCVAAAGNDGKELGSVIRPGNLQKVLCAGATVGDERVSVASGRGPVHVDPELPRGQVVTYEEVLAKGRTEDFMKPDVVAPGGDLQMEEPLGRKLAEFGIAHGPVSTRSSQSTAFLPIDPSDPDCMYTRICGTSQATAMVTGLATLLLEYGRKNEMDWGPNTGSALKAIMKKAAAPMAHGDRRDYGDGFVLWPSIKSALEDCITKPDVRDAILFGPDVELID